MANWNKFPHPSKPYVYESAALKKNWSRLHQGDQEPFPKDEAVQRAWRHFHAGEFQQAVSVGLEAGGLGEIAADKAQAIYAHYLEPQASKKLALLDEVVKRAEHNLAKFPKHANAHYVYAYALGRYSQCISVTKALSQGLGGKIKEAILQTLKLEPKHAEAHTAFGSYQAEIIDKVGGMVAGLTYGAKKESALEHYQQAIKLHPQSAIAHIEYANGLIMMFGKAKLDEATELYQQAAKMEPQDAMEKLDVELAKAELSDT